MANWRNRRSTPRCPRLVFRLRCPMEDANRPSHTSTRSALTLHPRTATNEDSTIPRFAFVPTYRERTITLSDPEYTPLNPGSQGKDGKRGGGIAEVSLMCRSDFGSRRGRSSSSCGGSRRWAYSMGIRSRERGAIWRGRVRGEGLGFLVCSVCFAAVVRRC